MRTDSLNTDELMELMREQPEQFDYLELAKELPLDRHLKDLMERGGMSPAKLVERSGLSKSFLYQILSGERLPGRDALLRIAFSLRLDLSGTQRLLAVGRKGALYPRVRRDAALVCCIQKGYGLFETDEFLEAAGEAPLL